MTVAVDTNVIGYAVSGTPEVARRARRALERTAAAATSMLLCPAVYSELLALASWTKSDLDAFVRDTQLRVDWGFPEDVWVQAGLAFDRYARRRTRKKASSPRRILADFLIGAHASGVGRLLTADGHFYRTNFSRLAVIDV